MKELVRSYLEQSLYKQHSSNQLKIDYLNSQIVNQDILDNQSILTKNEVEELKSVKSIK